ncbi:MAG: aldo/keto reductase [Pseudomonadota bacterium]
MRTIQLGRSGIEVTDYCLGTMTYGAQTPEADAHRQLSAAAAAGITFIDTAEMYPVNPIRPETVGLTERIIGNWLAQAPAHRDAFRIATKAAGFNEGFVRQGLPVTGATFTEAFEGSLKRLQTDYIDLYQLHWPNRGHYHFRQMWSYDPSHQIRAETIAHMEDVLTAAQALIDAGKMGAFGLSNETAWGTAQWVNTSDRLGLPRVASIQNEYSLLYRTYDTDLAELAVNEDVLLLAYSPLAVGILTGKYQGGAIPAGSRLAIQEEPSGRTTPRAFAATDAYHAIARRHGIDPVHMSLAFTVQRPFPVATIFGATTQAQLDHILAGLDTHLGTEILGEINATHRLHAMPF